MLLSPDSKVGSGSLLLQRSFEGRKTISCYYQAKRRTQYHLASQLSKKPLIFETSGHLCVRPAFWMKNIRTILRSGVGRTIPVLVFELYPPRGHQRADGETKRHIFDSTCNFLGEEIVAPSGASDTDSDSTSTQSIDKTKLLERYKHRLEALEEGLKVTKTDSLDGLQDIHKLELKLDIADEKVMLTTRTLHAAFNIFLQGSREIRCNDTDVYAYTRRL